MEDEQQKERCFFRFKTIWMTKEELEKLYPSKVDEKDVDVKDE